MQIFPAQYRKCHKVGWKLLLAKYQIYLFPNIKVYLDARIFTALVWRFAPSVLRATNQKKLFSVREFPCLNACNCHINWSRVLFYKLSQLCHQETPLLPGHGAPCRSRGDIILSLSRVSPLPVSQSTPIFPVCFRIDHVSLNQIISLTEWI